VTSNSDAAQLAETFATHNCKTKLWSHYSQTSSDPYLAIRNKFSESTQILQVIGVPVTLSGDLKNQFVETTVGFDTVCKVNPVAYYLQCRNPKFQMQYTDVISRKVKTLYHHNLLSGELSANKQYLPRCGLSREGIL
jgi:hypothetical protein